VVPDLSDGTILLRRWTAEDADWYAQESKDHEIQRFTSDPATLTGADVARAIEELDSARVVALLIADVDTGARLGNLAVDLKHGIGEVSYWVAAASRGRGVATAAIRLVADWLLATGRASELRLWTHQENVASQRAATKTGFVRDPDHDGQQQIKGHTCTSVAFRRTR
jgi:ribosomal-protein-alanine N-acetyltransferase